MKYISVPELLYFIDLPFRYTLGMALNCKEFPVDEEICSEQAVAHVRELVYAALKSTRGYVNYLAKLK